MQTATTRTRATASLPTEFMRFVVVGVAVTAIDLVCLHTLVALAGGRASGAGFASLKAVSFIMAASASYVLNSRFTFGLARARQPGRGARGRRVCTFGLVSSLGCVIHVAVATAALTLLRLTPIDWPASWMTTSAALAGSTGGMVWNFLGYRHLVFDRSVATQAVGPAHT